MRRRPQFRLPPVAALAALIVVSAATRFILAAQIRTPLLFPDEYIHTALARSVSDGTFPDIRGGSVSFLSYLGPLFMSPAWFIDDVDVAYRVAQAAGCIAFSLAAIPAYLIARRIGVRPWGSVLAALFALAIPDGVYTSNLVAESYSYPLFLTAVLVAIGAIAAPTVRRQLAVLAAIFVLPFVGGLQFLVFGASYLPAAYLAGPRSLRVFLRRQAVVLLAVGAAVLAGIAVIAVGGGGRINQVYGWFVAFDYPVLSIAKWFVVDLFVVAIAAGWVVVPAAAVGYWSLFKGATAHGRAFAALGVVLTAGLVAEATPFGANSGSVTERYAFYCAPLMAIACIWGLESARLERLGFRIAAYLCALTAFILPVVPPLLSTDIDQSPSLLGLDELDLAGAAAPVIWAPALTLLALATAWRGARHRRAVVVVAAAICLVTSLGVSSRVVHLTRTSPPDRLGVRDGAAYVAWGGSGPVEMMRTLFWNREIDRVLVVGRGIASDEYPFDRVRLVSPGRFVDGRGAAVPGPFVYAPDMLISGARLSEESPILTSEEAPRLIVVGWDRRGGNAGRSGWIFAVGDGTPERLVVRLRSADGRSRVYSFDCDVGGDRRVQVTPSIRRSVSISLPRHGTQRCRFSVVRGSFAFSGPNAPSVKGDVRLVRAGA